MCHLLRADCPGACWMLRSSWGLWVLRRDMCLLLASRCRDDWARGLGGGVRRGWNLRSLARAGRRLLSRLAGVIQVLSWLPLKLLGWNGTGWYIGLILHSVRVEGSRGLLDALKGLSSRVMHKTM